MKKLLLVIFVASLMIGLLSAQTLFSADNSLAANWTKTSDNLAQTQDPVILLQEGFEGTFPPSGWTRIDADGDDWQWRQWNQALKDLANVQGTPAIISNTGANSAFSQTYINPAENDGTNAIVLTPDNWLITPAITIPAGAEAELSFYVWTLITGYPTEQYSVLVSTTTPEIASFTSIYNQTLTAAMVNPSIRELPLTSYAGNTIYIAFRHHNSTDQFAMAIDDILVTRTGGDDGFDGVGIAPKNLTATQYGPQIERTVRLNWQAPETTVFATYTDPAGSNQSIGIGGPGQHIVAHRFDQEQIQARGINNSKLTRVQFHPRQEQNIISTTIKIYTGGNWTGDEATNNPGTLVHTQPVTATLVDTWVETVLTTPIDIPNSGEIWIGVEYVYTGGFIMGCDTRTFDDNYGNITYVEWDEEEEDGDYWTTLVALNPDLKYNWSVRGVVESELEDGLVLIGYDVSRDDVPLTTSPITSLEFEDVAPQGRNFYYVKAVYEQGDSAPSRVMIDVFTGLEPRNPPRNLVAVGEFSKVILTWEAPEGDRVPSEYEIYRNGQSIEKVAGDVFTLTNLNLVNGVNYEFYVRAHYVIPTGVSDPSNTAIGIPEGIVHTAFSPTNVRSSQFDQNVTIQWDEPMYAIPVDPNASEFSHPWGEDGYTISLSGPGVFGSAHRFSPEHLASMGVAGKQLVGAGFWGGNPVAAASGTKIFIRVYIGGTSVADPGELVYEQYWGVTRPEHAQETLSMGFYEPIDIPVDQELRIAFVVHSIGGSGNGPVFFGDFGATLDYGNLYLTPSGAWITAASQWPGEVMGNALVSGFAKDSSGNMIQFGNITENETILEMPKNFMYSSSFVEIERAISTSERGQSSRNLLTYNIYRGGNLLESVPVTQTSFTERDAPVGSQQYFVSAVYAEKGESERIMTSINVIERPYIRVFPHFEGFNTGVFPPNGWRAVNFSPENRNWIAISQGAFEGARTAGSLSRLPDGTNLNPDNWLITPRIVVPDDANTFWLTYWVGATHDERFAEKYSILLSTDTPDVDDFTRTLLTEVLSTDAWDIRYLDLAEFKGQTILLAFRHWDVTGLSTLKLDALTWDYEKHTDVNDPTVPPVITELLGNYPNPFNPETTIDFNLRAESHVSIEIFNIRGQKVRTLIDDFYGAGNHQAVWTGNDDAGRSVGSGVYFYRMNADGVSATRRMVLMK